MSKTIDQLIYDIQYQFPLWPSTYSTCERDGCEKPARGGRVCLDCLESDLAALTNTHDAREFVDACEHLSRIKHRLINA
jgi:hypothetical protein